MGVGAVNKEQTAGRCPQHKDAGREGQAVAPERHVAGQEPVMRHDRRQPRETGEAAIRRHKEDEHRRHLQDVVGRSIAEGRLCHGVLRAVRGLDCQDGVSKDLSAILLPPEIKDVSLLKKLPNLRSIGTNWKEAELPADQFWKKYGSRFR